MEENELAFREGDSLAERRGALRVGSMARGMGEPGVRWQELAKARHERMLPRVKERL